MSFQSISCWKARPVLASLAELGWPKMEVGQSGGEDSAEPNTLLDESSIPNSSDSAVDEFEDNWNLHKAAACA